MAFSTIVYLCSVPFTMDGTEQPWSETPEQQYSVFQSNWIKKTVNGIMTLHTGTVTLKGYVDEYRSYNYLIFKNKDKFYYAFITECEWASDNATKIYYKIDYFQTYQTDILFNDCYILRKIVTDDTLFSNCLDEDIGVSRYTSASKTVFYENIENYDIWVIDSRRLYYKIRSNPSVTPNLISNKLGTPYQIPFTIFVARTSEELISIFDLYNSGGEYDFQKVVSIQLVPKAITQLFNTIDDTSIFIKTAPATYNKLGNVWDGNDYVRILANNDITSPVYNVIKIPYNDLIGLGLFSDVPSIRNNKCYTGQFMKLKYRVQSVGDHEIRPEDISTATDMDGNILINKSVAFVNDVTMSISVPSKNCPSPRIDAFDVSLSVPIPFTSSSFAEWYNANKLKIVGASISYIAGIMLTGVGVGLAGAGAATTSIVPYGTINNLPNYSRMSKQAMTVGNRIGAAGSASLGHLLMQGYQASKLPDRVSLASNESVISRRGFVIDFIGTAPSAEDITRIDNYFSMFGYRVNEYSVPNPYSHVNWDYIQTGNCTISGDIPLDAKLQIENQFNSGVRLWHGTNFCNALELNFENAVK